MYTRKYAKQISSVINNLKEKLKTVPLTPKNVALNAVFAPSAHLQAYNAFLPQKIFHIYDEMGKKQIIQSY